METQLGTVAWQAVDVQALMERTPPAQAGPRRAGPNVAAPDSAGSAQVLQQALVALAETRSHSWFQCLVPLGLRLSGTHQLVPYSRWQSGGCRRQRRLV